MGKLFCGFSFAISGKDEDWKEALSGNQKKVGVISVTSTKRKEQPREVHSIPRKKQKKSKKKHKTGWSYVGRLYAWVEMFACQVSWWRAIQD